MADIQDDVKDFSVEDVSQCLHLLKLDKYIDKLADQQVNGALLVTLDEQMLQSHFEFTPFDARKLVLFCHAGWRP